MSEPVRDISQPDDRTALSCSDQGGVMGRLLSVLASLLTSLRSHDLLAGYEAVKLVLGRLLLCQSMSTLGDSLQRGGMETPEGAWKCLSWVRV